MTPNDWLSEIREDLLEVVDNNSVETKGMVSQFDELEVSVTITDQGDYFESYVVVDSSRTDIDYAVDTVRDIRAVIGEDDQVNKTVGTEKENRWAEAVFRVDTEKLRMV